MLTITRLHGENFDNAEAAQERTNELRIRGYAPEVLYCRSFLPENGPTPRLYWRVIWVEKEQK